MDSKDHGDFASGVWPWGQRLDYRPGQVLFCQSEINVVGTEIVLNFCEQFRVAELRMNELFELKNDFFGIFEIFSFLSEILTNT